jgi:7-carboxy-7-deazaguanine synthase
MALLRVTEIFASLQGEGHWTGVPMTFVRLAGCNASALGLDCVEWCDTPGSQDPDGGSEIEAGIVAAQVHLPRMCLTGGEPLMQPEGVTELVEALHPKGVRVHLETNGTVDSACHFDWVTVSPKPPHYSIAPGWEGRVDELKIVIDGDMDEAALERAAAAHPGAIVCLQPLWGRNPADGPSRDAVEKALSLVMDRPHWRLSMQTHKYLGIR